MKTTKTKKTKTPSKTKKSPAAKKAGGKSARPKKVNKPVGRGTTKKKAPRARKTLPAPTPAARRENPAAHALARRIAGLVSDKKALDVVILDVRGMTSYADYLVIASGESERQVSAMADNVLSELKKENHRPIGHEGTETGQWVLLDYGEVVANLFFTEVRSFYDLEGLWADAPREKVA